MKTYSMVRGEGLMAKLYKKKCVECGKEFTAAYYNSKLCSKECRMMWKQKYSSEKYYRNKSRQKT